MNSILLFFGGGEIFFIILIVLLLFGSKKIPELVRGLTKGIGEIRKATNDIKKEIDESGGDVINDIRKLNKTIRK